MTSTSPDEGAPPTRRLGTGDIIAAGATILIGAFAAFEATRYPIGEASRMGPGYFPVGLGLLLMACGVGILFERRGAAERRPRLISLIAICGAIAAFALLIDRFGMAPAVIVTTIIAAQADRNLGLVNTLLLAAALAVICTLVFISGLGMPVDIVTW